MYSHSEPYYSTDYGGDMPSLSEQDDPFRSYLLPAPNGPERDLTHPTSSPTHSLSCPLTSTPCNLSAKPPAYSRTSYMNPFYGYPITRNESASSKPTLQYGRRRKRDLLRTLAQLWWMRWGVQATVTLGILLLLLLALARKNSWSRRWRWRFKSPPALRSVVETLAIL